MFDSKTVPACATRRDWECFRYRRFVVPLCGCVGFSPFLLKGRGPPRTFWCLGTWLGNSPTGAAHVTKG